MFGVPIRQVNSLTTLLLPCCEKAKLNGGPCVSIPVGQQPGFRDSPAQVPGESEVSK